MIEADARAQMGSAEPVSAILSADGVTVHYGDVPVLRRVALSVAAGERVALIGLNGAGKSTLLRTLAGLLRPSEGRVLVYGRSFAEDAAGGRRALGFVGHEALLVPALTARENLEFYGRLYGVPDLRHRAAAALDSVRLLERADDAVRTLSRGMTQRVALARALLHAPTILLLDEPDAGLDVRAYADFRRVLLDAPGRALVMVTHNFEHAVDLCARVVILHGGRIAFDGPPAGVTAHALRRQYDELTAA